MVKPNIFSKEISVADLLWFGTLPLKHPAGARAVGTFLLMELPKTKTKTKNEVVPWLKFSIIHGMFKKRKMLTCFSGIYGCHNDLPRWRFLEKIHGIRSSLARYPHRHVPCAMLITVYTILGDGHRSFHRDPYMSIVYKASLLLNADNAAYTMHGTYIHCLVRLYAPLMLLF